MITQDYHCPKCNDGTYIECRTKPPKCEKCGEYMEPFIDE